MIGPFIVALAGYGHVGKDTIGEYLCHRRAFYRVAFTRPLYAALQAALHLSPAEMDSAVKDLPNARLHGMSLRKMLEAQGDMMRATFGEDILIRLADQEITAHFHGKQGAHLTDFVITDLRTEAEAAWVRKNNGHVWHVRNIKSANLSAHYTAQPIAIHPGEAVLINEGTLEQLYEQVDFMLEIQGLLEPQ